MQQKHSPVTSDSDNVDSFRAALKHNIIGFISNPDHRVLLLIDSEMGTLFSELPQIIEQIADQSCHMMPTELWQSNPQNTIHSAVEQKRIHCSSDELQQKKCTFIFNHYDQIETPMNLFVCNKLAIYPNSKLIISCTTEFLASFTRPSLLFTPFQGESPLAAQLSTIHCSNQTCEVMTLPAKQSVIKTDKPAAFVEPRNPTAPLLVDSQPNDRHQPPDDPLLEHMNQHNRSNQLQLVQFGADIIRKGDERAEQYRLYLIEVYQLTRINKYYRNAAAYAFSILIAANHSFGQEDLSELDLTGAVLDDGNLDGAFLENTRLNDASMLRTNLRGAKMGGANVTGAQLGLEFRQSGFYNHSYLLMHTVDTAGTYIFTVDKQTIRVQLKKILAPAYEEHTTLNAHTNTILWISLLKLNAASTHLVSLDDQGVMLLWQMSDWKVISRHQFQPHTKPIGPKELSTSLYCQIGTTKTVIDVSLEVVNEQIQFKIFENHVLNQTVERINVVHFQNHHHILDIADNTMSLLDHSVTSQSIFNYQHTTKLVLHRCLSDTLVLTDDKGFILIWNNHPWQIPSIIDSGQQAITAIELTPDANFIFTTGWDGYLKVWDVNTRKIVTQIQLTLSTPNTMHYHAEEQNLYVINDAGELQNWHLDELLVRQPDKGIRLTTVSADGKILYTVDDQNTITIGLTDLSGYVISVKIANIEYEITAICALKNDQIALGCVDGAVRIVSTQTQEIIAYLMPTHSQNGHSELRAVTALSYSRYDQRLLVGNESGYLHCWNISSVDNVRYEWVQQINAGDVHALSVTAEGEALISDKFGAVFLNTAIDTVGAPVMKLGCSKTVPIRKVLIREADSLLFQLEHNQNIAVYQYDPSLKSRVKWLRDCPHEGVIDFCFLGADKFVTIGADKSIVIWDSNFCNTLTKTDNVLAYVVALNREHFITVSNSGCIQKWRATPDNAIHCVWSSGMRFTNVCDLHYQSAIGISSSDKVILDSYTNRSGKGDGWSLNTLTRYVRARTYSRRQRKLVIEAINETPMISLDHIKSQFNFIVTMDKTSMFEFVRAGNLAAVKTFVESTNEHSLTISNGHTLLMAAAHRGHMVIVDYLITQGANINFVVPESGVTALLVAASDRNESAVAALIARGADAHQMSHAGLTALLACSKEGLIESIKLLRQQGVDLDAAVGPLKLTALRIAVETDQRDTMRYLLEQGVNTEVRDSNGMTPLLMACTKNVQCIQMLVQHGARLDVIAPNGYTPLMFATIAENKEGVQFLAKQGSIDVNDQIEHPSDNKGFAAVHFAASHRSDDMVRILIDAGADLTLLTSQGWTVLSIAVFAGASEVAIRLLDRGIELRAEHFPDQSYIPHLVRLSNDALANLVVQEVDLNILCPKGWSALHYFGRNCPDRDISLLLDLGLQIMNSVNGVSPLAEMVNNNKPVMLRSVLDRQPQLVNKRFFNNNTLLHLAAEKGYLEILSVLQEYNVDVDLEDNNQVTALLYALQNKHTSFVIRLLQLKPNVNVTAGGRMLPLIMAMRANNTRLVKALIDCGADVNQRVNNIASIHVTVACSLAITKLLVEAGADLSAAVQDDGDTALHLAVQHGREDIALYLIEQVVRLNLLEQVLHKPNTKGVTSLMFASSRDSSVIFDALLAHCHDHLDVSPNEATTALTIACANHKNEYVLKLLGAGADTNLINKLGATPLMWAAQAGNTVAARHLLKAGATATINHKAHGWFNKTALMFVGILGDCEFIMLLLENGADLQIKSRFGNALYMVAEHGHLAAVKLLVEKGIDIHVVSDNGYNAADAAFSNKHHAVTDYLVAKGLVINARLKETTEVRQKAQEHRQQFEFDKAIECAQRLCTLYQNEDSYSFQWLASLHAIKGEPQDLVKAEQCFLKSIQIDQRYQVRASNLCEYGLLLMRLQRLPEAFQCFLKAIGSKQDEQVLDLEFDMLEINCFTTLPWLATEIEQQNTLKINSVMLSLYCCFNIARTMQRQDLVFEFFKLIANKARQQKRVLYIKMLAQCYTLLGKQQEASKLLDNLSALTTQQTADEERPIAEQPYTNESIMSHVTHRYNRLNQAIDWNWIEQQLTQSVDVLVEDSLGYDLLWYAACEGQLHIVQALPAHGSDVKKLRGKSKETVHFAAVRKGHAAIIRYVHGIDPTLLHLSNNKGCTLLQIAIEKGHSEVAITLLELGVTITDFNFGGRGYLMFAAMFGCAEIIEALLLHDLAQNEQSQWINAVDESQMNALMIAAHFGHNKAVELFLRYGADVTQMSSLQKNCLLLASSNCIVPLTKWILDHNPDVVSLCNKRGETILHKAAQRNWLAVVQMIAFKCPAIIDRTAANGASALSYATQLGNRDIVLALLHAGANWTQQTVTGLNALQIALKSHPHSRMTSNLCIAANPQQFFGHQEATPQAVIMRLFGYLNRTDQIALSLTSRAWSFTFAVWQRHLNKPDSMFKLRNDF